MALNIRTVYIKVSNPAVDVDRIKQDFGCEELALKPGAEFVCVEEEKPIYQLLPLAFAEQFSSVFGEVIRAEISSAGSFHFEHWVMGIQSRCLMWAKGSAWECQGSQEPWEEAAWPGLSPEGDGDEMTIDPERVFGIIQGFYSLPPLS